MGLLITCILIYQFNMHWGFYVAAIVIAGAKLVLGYSIATKMGSDIQALKNGQAFIRRAVDKGSSVLGVLREHAQYLDDEKDVTDNGGSL